jgi:putative redox protein
VDRPRARERGDGAAANATLDAATLWTGRARGSEVMAPRLEVTATWLGGYAADVRARGHELRSDEPETAGGEDSGMMPTELFCAALASCFCLAIGWAATKRGRDVPGLRVTVRAERAGTELRYSRLVVDSEAALDGPALAELVERARPLCWVSNTLAQGVEVEYRHTPIDARFRK